MPKTPQRDIASAGARGSRSDRRCRGGASGRVVGPGRAAREFAYARAVVPCRNPATVSAAACADLMQSPTETPPR